MRTAFLEKSGDEWLNTEIYSIVEPLKAMGFEIESFNEFNYKQKFPIKGIDLVVGCIESVSYFLKDMGVEIPHNISYPSDIDFNRNISIDSLGNVFERLEKYGKDLFIKPAESVKLFTGTVLQANKMDLNKSFLKDYRLDTMVYVTDPFHSEILSEYRCFVYKNEIVGCKHYAGDFRITLSLDDFNYIKRNISYYKNAPIAYTIDIAIMKTGIIEFIECNDFWSIGGYGFDPKLYAKMINDRFYQITELKLV